MHSKICAKYFSVMVGGYLLVTGALGIVYDVSYQVMLSCVPSLLLSHVPN
jgi:hypothetical protein